MFFCSIYKRRQELCRDDPSLEKQALEVMIFYPVTLLLLFLTFVVQEFIPGIPIASHATLLLPPVFFFTAAVAVPFPMMLLLSFMTGLLWDARHHPAVRDSTSTVADGLAGGALAAPELNGSGAVFGLSIVIFTLLGLFLQGVRPLFKRGRVELPVLLVGFTTLAWLLMEYMTITFMRGSFLFPVAIWTKMVTDTMLAMLAAPLLFLILYSLAGLSRYEIRYEGLKYSFDGH